MTISNNYPTIRPSLDLDFANSEQLDPRITFSRSTTAAYYDANTTALAEQNLLLQSGTLTNAAWSAVNGTSSTSAILASDGISYYQIITATSGGNRFQQILTTLTTGLVYTLTFELYAGTSNYAGIVAGNSNSAGAIFNLSTGSVVSTSGTGVTASISAMLANGAYRCSLTFTSLGTSIYAGFGVSDGTTYNSSVYPSASTGTISGQLSQLEQRNSRTAYNATTTSAITNYIPVLQTAPINQARFDHDPVARTSLGLLIEQQSTNLWLQSQFASGWSTTNSTTSLLNNIAPDGTQTASLLVDNTTNGGHLVQQFATTTATSHTISVYAKAYQLSSIMLYSYWDSKGTGFNLSTGNIFTITGVTQNTSNSITPVGNGWYRCSITSTATAQTGATGGIYTVSGTTFSYAGTGQGIYIWGAQLEALGFPTSYIPTQASQVTRAADNASMTGVNFSSWYNNQQGALFANYRMTNITTVCGISLKSSINSGNIISVVDNSNSLSVYVNGAVSASSNFGIVTQNLPYKNALSYQVNNFGFNRNGVTTVTSSSGAIPSFIDNWTITNINGTVSKFSYYPVALTATQLQSLTGS